MSEGVGDMQDPLSYTECWESVMGRRTADDVVADFDLVPEGLDEWVAEAELAALSQLAVGYQRKMLEEACSLHHDAMVSDLIDAIDRAGMEASF